MWAYTLTQTYEVYLWSLEKKKHETLLKACLPYFFKQ